MAAQDSFSPAAQGPSTESGSSKRIHNLVVDTGPLIKNEPALSTLLSQADEIYTIPSVLSEIKVRNRSQSLVIRLAASVSLTANRTG